MEVAGSRSIAEVVSAARAMTGKPARASDQVHESNKSIVRLFQRGNLLFGNLSVFWLV